MAINTYGARQTAKLPDESPSDPGRSPVIERLVSSARQSDPRRPLTAVSLIWPSRKQETTKDGRVIEVMQDRTIENPAQTHTTERLAGTNGAVWTAEQPPRHAAWAEDLVYPEVTAADLTSLEYLAFGTWPRKLQMWAVAWRDCRESILAHEPATPPSCWPGAWWWPVPFGQNVGLALVLMDPATEPVLGRAVGLVDPASRYLWRYVVPSAQHAPWRATQGECETLYWCALMECCFFLGEPEGPKTKPAAAPKRALKPY